MNSKKTELQFTKLTPDDIATHEDLYIDILVNNGVITCQQHESAAFDKKYLDIYREYAIKETLKSKQLFCKTFGEI